MSSGQEPQAATDATKAQLTQEVESLQHEVAVRNAYVAALELEIEALRAVTDLQRDDFQHRLELLRTVLAECRVERDGLVLANRALRETSDAEGLPEESQARPSIQGAAQSSLVCPDRRALRVAGIADTFTHRAFVPTCQWLNLDVRDWKSQLSTFQPDLLFVESAWHGNDGQWTRKISRLSSQLRQVLDWCVENGVPSVFWNKEDPVHFESFIATAKKFDHIFTTDVDCVGRYKALLGHGRVHPLPFACQPAIHNPIASVHRQPGFCFAGSFYARYPERARDFDAILSAGKSLGDVVIYDRNHGSADEAFAFPEKYHRYIHGACGYDEIDTVYRGFDFGINLNSVKRSQSMFARRVVELMASNTVVVGNYSRAVRLLFGDLTISSDSARQLHARLKPLASAHPQATVRRRQQRLQALRKVMREHTVDDRMAYILSKVTGREHSKAQPSVVVLALVGNQQELECVLRAYERQRWPCRRLALVLTDEYVPTTPLPVGIAVYSWSDAEALLPQSEWHGCMIACFSPTDYYGPDYLVDAMLAFQYCGSDAVGKVAHYRVPEGTDRCELNEDGAQYTYVDTTWVYRSVVRSSAVAAASARQLLTPAMQGRISGLRCLAIDEFSYCAGVESRIEALAPNWVDCQLIDDGLPMARLDQLAEGVVVPASDSRLPLLVGADGLFRLFERAGSTGQVRVNLQGEFLTVKSSLEGGHKYLYADQPLPVEELCVVDGRLDFNLSAEGQLPLDLAIIYLDADGNRLGHVIRAAGRNHSLDLMAGTTHVLLALRVRGEGSAMVRGLAGHVAQQDCLAVPLLGRSPHLLVTNVYPSEQRLYRNAFVHRRVVGYREAGLDVDVFAMSLSQASYEFDNVDVLSGDASVLDKILKANGYESILVHFLDPEMWRVISHHRHHARVLVWVHGAEIQPWHRRAFNYGSEQERQEAVRASDSRMRFWREVMGCRHPNLHFIFVSRYFAEEVMTDVGVRLHESQYSIIHNFIDTNLFQYHEKPADQRKKILSIRPYASRKYANDLSVEAVLALSKESYFNDLEFRFIGDGELFDETLAPLRGFPNVRIERRFVEQHEIASLHRNYGIFLCPTRMDSQGVSKDEAMSSGLVPVTNAITAIPEFVDAESGMLAGEEDAEGLAAGIDKLVNDPAMFQRLSRNAAQRVRVQCGEAATLARERDLIARRV